MAAISLKLVEHFISLPKIEQTISTNYLQYKTQAFDLSIITSIIERQGFEVEGTTIVGEHFNSVVIGKIEHAEPHPNANKLQVCKVLVAPNLSLQIICGAPNARPGLYVAVALPGAKLPAKNGETFEIKVSSIRGVESSGMLCSRAELGLPVMVAIDGDGIWELSQDAQGGKPEEVLTANIGKPVFDILDLSDVILDLNILANRPDARSHQGIAREFAVGFAFANISFENKNPSFTSLISETTLVENVFNTREISVNNCIIKADNDLGISAFFIVLNNIKVAPTPAWLRNRLETLGQNSINNIVDASNYILLAYGHPSHAFDANKLAKTSNGELKLFLRPAANLETIVALDGKERQLTPDDCVVADSKQPQALLGVIGGDLSKVDESTTTIIIEIANPNSVSVRRSARRHGRITESAMAFDKGIDVASRFAAASNLVNLINTMGTPLYVGAFYSHLTQAHQAYADNKGVDFSVALKYPALSVFSTPYWKTFIANKIAQHTWNFLNTHPQKILGVNLIEFDRVKSIFISLGFTINVNESNSTQLNLTTPHWRWWDIAGIADLVEEISRVVGIDNIPAIQLPANIPMPDDAHLGFFSAIAQKAVNLGFTETASFHFMKEDDLTKLLLKSPNSLGEPLTLINPIIKDEPLMQTSLIPNLLRKVSYNLSFGNMRGQIFEAARTYQNTDKNNKRVFENAQNCATIGQYHRVDELEATEASADTAYIRICEEAESNGQRRNRQPADTGHNLFDYHPSFALDYCSESRLTARPAETQRLAAIVFGARLAKSCHNNAEVPWDFFTCLSMATEICKHANIAVAHAEMPVNYPFANALHFHKRVVLINKTNNNIVGWVGEFHPKALRNFGINIPCFGFEINLALLFSQIGKQLAVAPSPRDKRFPLVMRDFSFIFPDAITANTIICTMQKACTTSLSQYNIPAALRNVDMFDIYNGANIKIGTKSVALRITIEPLTRTLTDSDIQNLSQQVITSMAEQAQGILRS